MNKKSAKLADISKGLGHSNVKITLGYLEEPTGYRMPMRANEKGSLGYDDTTKLEQDLTVLTLAACKALDTLRSLDALNTIEIGPEQEQWVKTAQ